MGGFFSAFLWLTAPKVSPKVTYSKDVLNILNDDCWLEISEYLSIQDARNLGATCRRLWKLTNFALIPKIARKLELIVFREKQTVFHSYSCLVTVDSLRSQVMLLGDFVEHISIKALHSDASLWPTFGRILKLCPNLKTLRIENAQCNKGPSKNFSELLSNVSPQLKELHWIGGDLLTKASSVVIKNLSELKKLTVRGDAERCTFTLFKHCNRLIYLDIEYYEQKSLPSLRNRKTNILKMFLENNGQTLRTLKLKSFDYFQNASISQLIAEKLPRLESLEVSESIQALRSFYGYYELKQVNILKLSVGNSTAITALMTALSGFGVIEELSITGSFYMFRAGLLTFKKLRKLNVYQRNSKNTAFVQIFTKAHMPELRHITIEMRYCEDEGSYFNELLELVKSKKSLTSLWIRGLSDLSWLVVKIIEMLKADLSGDRPFLKLFIQREIGEREASAPVSS